ncbi:MAG: glutamate ABC transporter substrate-binding protein [Actinomycetota bacterium]
MRRRSFLINGVVAALVLAGAACRPESTPRSGRRPEFAAGSYMAQIQDKGKVVIGVKYDIPRFGFLNPATGKPEGFDVDLGKAIAERLGVQAEFIEAISTNRIPFLQEDKADLIISTMTINEERRQQIDFSTVYYVARQRLLARKGSRVRDVASLDAQKAEVCSAKGSTSAQNIAAAAPNAPLRLLDGYAQCFQLLQNDQVQAVFTDDVILTGLLSRDRKNFKIVGDPVTVEPYGVGMKKGRPEFVAFVDDSIREIKRDGDWVKLYDRWVKPLTGESAEPPPDEVPFSGPSLKPV